MELISIIRSERPLVRPVENWNLVLINFPRMRDPVIFYPHEELFKRCKENGDIYCVTRYKENVEELKRRVSTLEVLWDNGEFYLLRLRC